MNGNAAQKLLDRMRNSYSGWRQEDFEKLFLGFGFGFREGKKHRVYVYPNLPTFSLSVPRHNDLKEWVARDAVKLIDDLLKELEKQGDNNGDDKENA